MQSRVKARITQNFLQLVRSFVFLSSPLLSSVRGTATASYRLLPHVILDDANPVPPHLATRFRDCFSPGVIKVDPRTKKVSVDEHGVRGETMSREVLRHPDLAEYVKLARVRDHFICTLSLHKRGMWKL